VSSEQDGCLRLSLFLNMNFDVTQDSRQSSYVIVHDMWCQWCGVLAFLTLTTFGLCLPTQSKDEQDWTGLVILAIRGVLLQIKCGPSCSSIFPICPVTVGIRIPSSTYTPQVGFMWRKASTTLERFKSQGHRRRSMEVPYSGVPLGSLARFSDGCRLWEINSRVWKST